MSRQENNKSSFWKKLLTRYKLSFFRENTLEEVWTIHLSRLNAILLTIFLVIIIGLGVTSLIVSTPIRSLLPGYLQREARDQVVDNALRIDSLMKEMEIRDRYINNITDILTGNISSDSDSIGHDIDSTRIWSPEILTNASTESKDFAQRYEDDEKFTLNMLPPPTEGLLFYTPVKGNVIESFNQQKGIYGVAIQTARKAAVSAVLDGAIISVIHTIKDGYVVTIQHNNNYVSIYRNNAEVLRNVGDKVTAGEKIAIVGTQAPQSGVNSIAFFELWHTGVPLNPQEYISF